MNAELAVIGGLGFSLEGLADEIDTPYGKVPVALTRLKGRKVVFISRHGREHLPPHKVNYRALISAARNCGATRIISTNTVGTMAGQAVGNFFLPSDFVEFTKSRPNTLFEDKAVHVDMSEPYCPELRVCLAETIGSLDLQSSEGTYVCTEGPHLESPAQIRMMRRFGDVVGMTGYPEVVLAREAGLCYASLCIVTNLACGLGGPETVKISGISDFAKQTSETVREIIYRAAQTIPAQRSCHCQDALSDALL